MVLRPNYGPNNITLTVLHLIHHEQEPSQRNFIRVSRSLNTVEGNLYTKTGSSIYCKIIAREINKFIQVFTESLHQILQHQGKRKPAKDLKIVFCSMFWYTGFCKLEIGQKLKMKINKCLTLGFCCKLTGTQTLCRTSFLVQLQNTTHTSTQLLDLSSSLVYGH